MVDCGRGRLVCFCGMGREMVVCSCGMGRRVDRWGVSGGLKGWIGGKGRSVCGEGGEDGGERGVVVHFPGCW